MFCWRVLAVAVALLVSVAGDQEKSICDTCGCNADTIDCTGRNLTELPESWPSNINTTTTAIFDHNNLVHVVGFDSAPSLRLLSLKGNRIQQIDDDAFQNLTALHELDLSYNELSSAIMRSAIFWGLPGDVQGSQPLSTLRVLRLTSNSIHSLPAEIFSALEGLKVLTLAYNPLRVLDHPTIMALTSLSKLEVLDLAHCELDALPNDIVHTPQALKVLNLTGNSFTSVPSALQLSRSIIELRLGENPIRELESGTFPQALGTVRVLYLDYLVNLTQVGPGALAPLRNLTELHLSFCRRLRTIDPRAFHTPPNFTTVVHPPVKKLVLRGNALEYLDEDLLRNHWEALTEIDLQDNKWNCDCDSQWMVDTLESIINASRPDLLRNTICESPQAFQGKSLFDLRVQHAHLCRGGGGGLSGASVALLGVIVGVLLAVPATLAGILFWRRGGLPWFGSGPAAFSRAYYSRTDTFGDF